MSTDKITPGRGRAMNETVECPICLGKGGWVSSGDGWTEYDECWACGETGRVTPERKAKIEADSARMEAWIDEQRRAAGEIP